MNTPPQRFDSSRRDVVEENTANGHSPAGTPPDDISPPRESSPRQERSPPQASFPPRSNVGKFDLVVYDQPAVTSGALNRTGSSRLSERSRLSTLSATLPAPKPPNGIQIQHVAGDPDEDFRRSQSQDSGTSPPQASQKLADIEQKKSGSLGGGSGTRSGSIAGVSKSGSGASQKGFGGGSLEEGEIAEDGPFKQGSSSSSREGDVAPQAGGELPTGPEAPAPGGDSAAETFEKSESLHHSDAPNRSPTLRSMRQSTENEITATPQPADLTRSQEPEVSNVDAEADDGGRAIQGDGAAEEEGWDNRQGSESFHDTARRQSEARRRASSNLLGTFTPRLYRQLDGPPQGRGCCLGMHYRESTCLRVLCTCDQIPGILAQQMFTSLLLRMVCTEHLCERESRRACGRVTMRRSRWMI